MKRFLLLLLVCTTLAHAEVNDEVKLAKVTAECSATFAMMYIEFKDTKPPNPEFLHMLGDYMQKSLRISQAIAEDIGLGKDYSIYASREFAKNLRPMDVDNHKLFMETLGVSGQACKYLVDNILSK